MLVGFAADYHKIPSAAFVTKYKVYIVVYLELNYVQIKTLFGFIK